VHLGWNRVVHGKVDVPPARPLHLGGLPNHIISEEDGLPIFDLLVSGDISVALVGDIGASVQFWDLLVILPIPRSAISELVIDGEGSHIKPHHPIRSLLHLMVVKHDVHVVVEVEALPPS